MEIAENRKPLQDRVRAILAKPADEWRVIAAETTDVTALMRDYAAPLAAIPAVCRFIGLAFVGVSVPFLGTYRIGIVQSLTGAIVSWVLSLVGVWIAAMVIDKLAPSFDSRPGMVQAAKLVVYAMTPVWVAGVLNLVPPLAALVLIAALYGVYLFYLGLPILMATPSDKVIVYMIVSAIVVIVVSVVLGMIAAAATGLSMYASF